MENIAIPSVRQATIPSREQALEGLRVLIIDDNPADRDYYARLLTRDGFSVLTAGTGPEGLVILTQQPVQCVLLDYNLPNPNGVDVLIDIVSDPLQKYVPVIMLTGYGNQHVAVDAMKSGAADYLLKDEITASALKRSVVNAYEKSQLRQEIHAHARDLEKTNKSLRKRNEEIKRFYHTISHEIKTPLAAAREFISLIQDEVAGPVTEEQNEYLELSIECCDQLATHLNNLIDSTRLDAGKLTIVQAPFEIAGLIKKATASASALARDLDVEIKVDIEDNLPRPYGDKDRIAQVLCNLLSNAVKSSKPKQVVTVRVRRVDNRIEFAVVDNGCGIDEVHQTGVFDRLYQIPQDGPSVGGLGLGLSIARELICLHGSTIEIQSKLGHGSTFSFQLAIAADAGEEGKQ